jgi:hypothetical protein
MKLHSFVDVITNSSSTVFICSPDINKLNIVAQELGFDRIEVNLSKSAIDGFKYDIKDYLQEKGLPTIEEWDIDELYNVINNAYLDGSISLYIDSDPYTDNIFYTALCSELEIALIDSGGQTRLLSDIIGKIERTFQNRTTL